RRGGRRGPAQGLSPAGRRDTGRAAVAQAARREAKRGAGDRRETPAPAAPAARPDAARYAERLEPTAVTPNAQRPRGSVPGDGVLVPAYLGPAIRTSPEAPVQVVLISDPGPVADRVRKALLHEGHALPPDHVLSPEAAAAGLDDVTRRARP